MSEFDYNAARSYLDEHVSPLGHHSVAEEHLRAALNEIVRLNRNLDQADAELQELRQQLATARSFLRDDEKASLDDLAPISFPELPRRPAKIATHHAAPTPMQIEPEQVDNALYEQQVKVVIDVLRRRSLDLLGGHLKLVAASIVLAIDEVNAQATER